MINKEGKKKNLFDYLDNFGLFNLAEENNFYILDFENSIKRYLKNREKRPHGRYKFGELENKYMTEFSDSIGLNFN